MIEKLEPHQIFVFGSNLAGNHRGGAALQAHIYFGAEDGVGEGMTGQCYAFPTLSANGSKLTFGKLARSAWEFYRIAALNPYKQFILTKVGTGIAGYPIEFMRRVFLAAGPMPGNVIPYENWL